MAKESISLGWLKDRENIKFSPYVLLDGIKNLDGSSFKLIIEGLLGRVKYIRSDNNKTLFTNGKDGATGTNDAQIVYCTIGADGIQFGDKYCIVYEKDDSIEVNFPEEV